MSYECVEVEAFKDPHTLAECRYEVRQIVMKKGQSKKAQISGLIHEILHSVCHERGIEISHKAIYQLEQGIYYVLFHNDWDINGE